MQTAIDRHIIYSIFPYYILLSNINQLFMYIRERESIYKLVLQRNVLSLLSFSESTDTLVIISLNLATNFTTTCQREYTDKSLSFAMTQFVAISNVVEFGIGPTKMNRNNILGHNIISGL